jgi:hypothetical protein
MRSRIGHGVVDYSAAELDAQSSCTEQFETQGIRKREEIMATKQRQLFERFEVRARAIQGTVVTTVLTVPSPMPQALNMLTPCATALLYS